MRFIKYRLILIKRGVRSRTPKAVVLGYVVSATYASSTLALLDSIDRAKGRITWKQYWMRCSTWAALWCFCQAVGQTILVKVLVPGAGTAARAFARYASAFFMP